MSSSISAPLSAESGFSSELSAASALLVDICDDYTNRKRAGESPSVEDYVARYPEMADRIREILASLDTLDTVTQTRGRVSTGTILAGCEIIREIGSGATGTVYEAVHPSISRRLAIKILNVSGVSSQRLSDRFLIEAEASSRLSHPNIVPFIDYGVDDNHTYLSMHCIHGVSLDILLDEFWTQASKSKNRRRLQDPSDATTTFTTRVIAKDFQSIAKLGADIASALGHAHSERVIHRDIKPGNLILDQSGKIWVTDFGLAKIHANEANLSQTGDMIGTPRYMSPEQIRGICSHHSDIYSLGITLYELATGKRAWDSVSRSQLLSVRQGLELPPISDVNPHVPDELARIIMKACSLRPEDRYQSATELHNVLERFSTTGKKGDRRRGERFEGQRYVRKRPFWITGICLLVAGVIGGSFLGGASTPDLEDPAALLEALQDDEMMEEVVSSIPDDAEDDTSAKREKREELATLATKALFQASEALEMTGEDEQFFKEQTRLISDAFIDGQVTKASLAEARREAAKSPDFFLLKLQGLTRQILKSSWSKTDKRTRLGLLQEVFLAVVTSKVKPETVKWLSTRFPESDAKGIVREDHLLVFLNDVRTMLNTIPDLPKGPPGSPARLRFLQTR